MTTSCILAVKSFSINVTAFLFSPFLYKLISLWLGRYGLPNSKITFDLNSYLLKYFIPDGMIVGIWPVFRIVPKVAIAIPALNGIKSV